MRHLDQVIYSSPEPYSTDGGTAAQAGGADCPGSYSVVLAELGCEPHGRKAALWGPPNLEKSLQACSVAFLGLLALPADKLDK